MKNLHCLSVFFLASIFLSYICLSQNIDSLSKVYTDKTQVDTIRMKACIAIAWAYRDNKPDTSFMMAKAGLVIAEKYNKPVSKVSALITMGVCSYNKGNYPKAMEYYFSALKIANTIHNTQEVGLCYINMGNVYAIQTDYPKALECFEKGLKIAEELNDEKRIFDCYTNMGNVYVEQANYTKALDYFLKTLIYNQKTKNRLGEGYSYSNIALVYNHQLDYKKALANYLKSLAVLKEFKDKSGMVYSYNSIGELYISLTDLNTAIKYIDSSLNLNREIGDINMQLYSYDNLASIYAKRGRYKEAYENHVVFKQLTDSLFNTDNSKQLGDMKTNFEVEKKESELKVKAEAEQEKLKAVAHEEKKRQQIIIGAVAGVLLIVVVFSLFLYKRFRVTKRQKNIIEQQKVMVDKAYNELHEKNKEVMDSIRYAKRIQTALITSEKYIENSINKLIKNKTA